MNASRKQVRIYLGVGLLPGGGVLPGFISAAKEEFPESLRIRR